MESGSIDEDAASLLAAGSTPALLRKKCQVTWLRQIIQFCKPQQYVGENDVLYLLGIWIDKAKSFCSQPHPLLLLAEEAVLNGRHWSTILHSCNDTK